MTLSRLTRITAFVMGTSASALAQAQAPEFERDVLPVFEDACTVCHGPDLQESALRLDSEAAVLRGGVSGPVLLPGNVPELMDIASEPASVHAMYGTEPGRASFANNCLLARRLVERGVRFVQLYHWGWDHHGTSSADDIATALPTLCEQTDRASAALVKDLKERGMLDDTLIVWGGEFGRTAMNEGRNQSKSSAATTTRAPSRCGSRAAA